MNLKKLYSDIKRCLKSEQGKLPSNCYFLSNDSILALKNNRGDARYPYARDGLILWAYSSGYISISEGNFFVSPLGSEGKEPYLSFFGGLKNKNNRYDFFSINGAGDSLFGKDNVEKYTVFTQTSAIYIRVYKKVIYALEISVSKNKEIIATIKVENNSNKDVDVYTSSFVNALLTHTDYESEETKWFRKSTINKDGATIYSVEDLSREIHLHNYMVLKRFSKENVSATSTRMLYIGDKNGQLATSKNLLEGKFSEEKQVSQFIDMAVYGDIIKKTLQPKESFETHYKMSLAFSDEDVKKLEQIPFGESDNSNDFLDLIKENNLNFLKSKRRLDLQVKGLKNTDVKDDTFNKFIQQVIKQVDYCCRTKNSSPMMLGVRDVAQMLEAMCMWNPKYVKEKMLFVLNHVFESGRTPRQISQFGSDGTALYDTREFIDQGQWLITTTYKYLCYTNDYDFLNEKCGYSKYLDARHGMKSDQRDSVYSHLKRIMDYLISNIDNKTHCLKTLFGDWNDAVDGLGSPASGSEGFGNGVSIMASFHLYQNLNEFITIASSRGEDVSKYLAAKKELTQGLKEHSYVTKGQEHRIVHGWGNDQSFYVGSFNDVDGKSRHSSTSNSFYISSGFYKEEPSLVKSAVDAFKALDSKYGLLTFDVPFLPKEASKVGRIVNLPPGTAENAATYIHAGIYAVRALGMIKEIDFAYEQMMKLIPLTHKEISTSPFVMPNSYGYNPKIGVDGQSMNDWYTGSSNTLLKALVESFIGIYPLYDNKVKLDINKLPFEEVKLSITIKGHRIKLHQVSKGNKNPQILVNNEAFDKDTIELDKYKNDINIEINY